MYANQDSNNFVILGFGICLLNHKSSGSFKTLQFALPIYRELQTKLCITACSMAEKHWHFPTAVACKIWNMAIYMLCSFLNPFCYGHFLLKCSYLIFCQLVIRDDIVFGQNWDPSTSLSSDIYWFSSHN